MIDRRRMLQGTAAAGALATAGLPLAARAQRANELNILCWEGYNSDEVLGPFRRRHDARVRAESGTSDPDMINKLRAGEVNVWDLINLNQPWARQQLYPAGLIKPIDKDRFAPYFDRMMAPFDAPYPLAFDDTGEHMLGVAQRFGPFSFVVNTDVISRDMAEDQGFKLFLDPAMQGRMGVLTYDNWNLMHMCMAADLDPFSPLDEADFEAFEAVARTIFDHATLLSSDLAQMNLALINGEIDAYFTGGTYTASPARLDGQTQVRAITPRTGPVDGKSGILWVELTSVVNNPNVSPLAEEFLSYIQEPEVAKLVAFAEGTYNPVTQMGDPAVMDLFSAEELDAIQWDSIEEEMANCVEYQVVADYDRLLEIYNAAKRG